LRRLITPDGRCTEPTVAEIRRLAGDPDSSFWLDIERPDADDFALLLDGFGFHSLTVEDVRQQNQRPKLDEFNGYVFAVLFTAVRSGDELAFREHHLYLSPRRLVSVHNDPSPALEELVRRLRESPDLARGEPGFLHYLAVNALVESLFPVLDALDDSIDTLQDTLLVHAVPSTLGRITELKHSVTDLRRVIGAQREMFQRLLSHTLDQPGELSLYWRDVYEHLVRQYEEVDSLRDLLTGSMDVYLSTVSNRLNTTMKQLTVIASLFLPLTFLTGFFGMNFAVLVGSIVTRQALVIGLGIMLLSAVLQLYLFWRRGWL
jgi:magnesium transporter